MHKTNVQVLGWDIDSQTGLFTNDFADPQQGQILAKQLINQGADILFPVAGPAGYGAAAEASTHTRVYVIGVDTDWAVERPDYARVILNQRGKTVGCQHFSGYRGHRHTNLQGWGSYRHPGDRDQPGALPQPG